MTGCTRVTGETIGVLELGTNSLKLHLPAGTGDSREPSRMEWDVGYEVYSSGRISEKTITNALAQVHALLAEHRIQTSSTPVLGIATGAFRDAENAEALRQRLDDEMGIPLRVIRTEEEASLLIQGAGDRVAERPGMAFDLGGGSLDMVYFGRDGSWLREALPLGAIRLHHLGLLGSGIWDERPVRRWIEKTIQQARSIRLPVIHGTGGTVKAIAQVAGTSMIPLDLLEALEADARHHGAPPGLSHRRRILFLPGLMVLRAIAERTGATVLRYTRVDVGEILLERLRPFWGALRGPQCRSILFQHLEIFRPEGPPADGNGGKSPAPVEAGFLT